MDVTYTGDRFLGRPAYLNGGPMFLDAYTLTNARLAWVNQQDSLQLAVAATNLTNRYYAINQFNQVSPFTPTAYDTIGQPRIFKLEIKKKFR